VNNVWQTRHRLVLEQLEKLADQLRGKQQIAPAVLEEQTVRLLTSMVMLLRQHNVNKRGQCRFCATSRHWQFWQRRPRCAVYRTIDFVMSQSLDVVWWQLFTSTGTKCSLVDVREWMRQRERQALPGYPLPSLSITARHP